ncbi:MAG: muconolactone delta-isomerase [Rhodospirillaceae bacterium]|jgi:muconolactone D-isomerase|nr:muconolactone delta-isomerase [Rhodospirillaceae bacterium]MBT5944217.1 muconolactone delta-isomerase [Rhodospirillaceae bacterium]MBT6403630.1 muconolactone delta-isomerase [Rhodospirillaceae bacterium]MBT6536575.1 muconolactone delta-isomerase [Rhodospirillaceae bacterium]MBT7360848.1 muconolactone delta-isomerase [Rhodospirillaceae bacterium]
MLFMVRIKVELPGEMDPAKVKALGDAEADRAIELIQAGRMRKVWRIVGERANFSIWEADSLEDFHADISSLPLHPWMSVDVTPMIEHPATQAYEDRVGPFPTI